LKRIVDLSLHIHFKLEGLAAEEDRNSRTIRGILATMDSYVTDRQ
jgi:hypothetical protein